MDLPVRMENITMGKRSIALIMLFALSCVGQIRVNLTNEAAMGPGTFHPAVGTCNESDHAQRIEGWRFRTGDFAGYTTSMSQLTHSGTGPVEYTQRIPAAEAVLLASSCRPATIDYTGTVPVDQDGTLFDPQALVKIGSCNVPPAYKDAAPLTCAALGAVAGGASYYDNQCLETSANTARNRIGGFIASFEGQTQIQAALPKAADSLLGMRIKWAPGSLGGPQYMMALAMAQEILNVDMRFLAAVGGKETVFGFVQEGKDDQGSVSEWAGYNRDADDTFSPWELESASFARLMKSYPGFFPKYGPCMNRYQDITASMSSCLGGNMSDAAAFYMRTPGRTPTGTGSNSPQLANSIVSAALAFAWIHDGLLQGTDLFYSQALASGKDRWISLAAILPAYNLGVYTDFARPLTDPAIVDDPAASSRFPMGNNNYRGEIFRVLDWLAATAAKSTACGGSNTLYDAPISFNEIQRFFFGGSSAPGTPQVQGDGGLLLHFDLLPAERQALLAALQCGFAGLKGKAPSVSGQEAISYRYDWLSMLRIAKAFLPRAERALPVESDFNYLAGKYSLGSKMASGQPKDVTYPSLTLVSIRPGAVVGVADSMGLIVSGSAKDDSSEVRVDWSLDGKGKVWTPGGMAGNGGFSFRVPCSAKGFPAPGQKAALWVRVTDSCGNAMVQRLEFTLSSTSRCGDPVGIRPPAGSRPGASPYRVEIRGGSIRIVSHPALRGAVRADANGRRSRQGR